MRSPVSRIPPIARDFERDAAAELAVAPVGRGAEGSAGEGRAARAAAALAREPAGAGARHASLGLHLAAAEVAGLRGIGGGEQAPARVAALGAADRLQPHRANRVHGGRRTLSDFLSKRKRGT